MNFRCMGLATVISDPSPRGNCGIGNERKEKMQCTVTELITEIIERSTAGPEWHLLHNVKEERAGLREEGKKDKTEQPQI